MQPEEHASGSGDSAEAESETVRDTGGVVLPNGVRAQLFGMTSCQKPQVLFPLSP